MHDHEDWTFQLLAFEELDGAFVRKCSLAGLEGAQIPAFASFGVLLTGVEAVLAGFQFANHDGSPPRI
jgi:hypothetical protein